LIVNAAGEAALQSRWLILIVLFFARCTMAAQFECIGALAPLLRKATGLTIGEIGLLIGLYLLPGAVLALPGGAITRALGDKRTMLLTLLLMIGGGLLAMDTDWQMQLLARLICGAGGVVLTVSATKMIVDLFAGRELATALGLFVNSWPAGIAIALVSLPAVGERYGLQAALLVNVVLPAVALLVVALVVPGRAPGASGDRSHSWPARPVIAAVMVVGVAWGIMNAAFATLFSFGPTLLFEKGQPAASAASIVSIVLWVTIIAIPIGGLIADRLPNTRGFIFAGVLVGAGLTFLVPRTDLLLPFLIVLGLVAGLPGAAVMSLPSRVLSEETRAIGMGVFYTAYYCVMLLLPPLQGAIAKLQNNVAITFDVAGVLLLLAIPALLAFDRLANHRRPLVACQ
jgi:MFS family permease